MLRKLVALGLSAAVHAAAVGSPLVHAHLGTQGSGHHPAHSRVHAHVFGHESSHHHDAARSLDDDHAGRTVYLQLFVAVGAASFELPPAEVSSMELVVPVAPAPWQRLHVVHGHDPPSGRSLPSRAPPALLS